MFEPKCVAKGAVDKHENNATIHGNLTKDDYFRSVQWSADGTSLIAVTATDSIQTFIVPPDLLEDSNEPRILTPYCTISSNDAVSAVIGYPFFNLEDQTTTLVLSSRRDLPIRFNSALTGHLGASYPLVNPMTEAYICPNALLFSHEGTRFIAGSDSLLSIFDLSRSGQEPISSLPTGPRRRKDADWNPAVNMRGLVSALALDPPTRVLAAGTYNRHVGLYDAMGEGECIGVFSVKGTAADAQIGGGGVTQVTWSTCGRYLYITERKSDGVILYDIRKTGQLLAWLEGRAAQTNQRMGVDVVSTDALVNHEIWAGGIDGCIRMWRNPHQSEGSVAPEYEFESDADAVSTVAVHKQGGVLATTCGQRHFWEDEQSDVERPSFDSSLKIWAL